MKEVFFAGFGGQGVLTANLVLAYAANEKGVNVSWMPAYGPAKRGGTSNSTVKFGEYEGERIGVPLMRAADAAVIMNEPSLAFLRFCKPGATVFINSNAIPDDVEVSGDYEVYRINSDHLAYEAHNPKGTSIVMLGALTKACGYYDKDYMIEKMLKMFAEKGKSKFADKNVAAFEAGYNAI